MHADRFREFLIREVVIKPYLVQLTKLSQHLRYGQ